MKLYRKQVEGGWVFLHENIAYAKSWELPCIKRMMREVGVDIVEADQCMYGLHTRGKSKFQMDMAEKPTKFITNSRSIGRGLSKECDGEHPH